MLYSYGHIQHDTRNERHKVPKQIGDNQCVHTALELRAVPPPTQLPHIQKEKHTGEQKEHRNSYSCENMR